MSQKTNRKPRNNRSRRVSRGGRNSSGSGSKPWQELRTAENEQPTNSDLVNLIEQDAPLKNHSNLVLMYGPFQAAMSNTTKQGVASWIRDCVQKHGLPSLVRFDHRRRVQIFRRDQFQAWLEPFIL